MAALQAAELQRIGTEVALKGRQESGPVTELTELEEYTFDVGGWLVLRGALSPAEVAAVGGLGDAAQELTDHPTILSYASLLCGEEAVLDLPPAHLEERQQAAGALTGAEYERARWGRAYTHRGGTRICLGIDVVVPLEEGFVYRLCPGTHSSLAPLPSDYTSAGPPSDDDPLLRSVPLQPGDVLLVASTVLGRGSGPAIAFSFRSASARPANPQPGVAPEWLQGLSQEERAAIGWGGDASPSDEDQPAAEAVGGFDEHELFFWRRCAKDATGYMVIRQMMDPGWVAAAEHAIDECYEPTTPEKPEPYDTPDFEDLSRAEQADARLLGWDAESWAAGAGTEATELAWEALPEGQREAASRLGLTEQKWPDAARATGPMRARPLGDRTIGNHLFRIRSPLAGHHRPGMGGLFTLPHPHDEPFKLMVTHPALRERIDMVMGPGAVLSNPPGAICSGLGTSGHALHAGGARITATSRYDYINGRAMCANINVVYQMRKVTEADGGFCVIPGSHKAALRLPGVREDFTGQGFGLSADPTALAATGHLHHVALEPGDVLIFLGAGVTHGAFPWTGEEQRRCVLMSFAARHTVQAAAAARL